MHTNGNDMELIPFITFIKLARWQKGTNAQLRHELEKVTAERDALQRKLDGYHCTARNTRIVDIRELDLAAHKVIL